MTNDWLNWTDTMRAKPKKCVTAAWRQFHKGSTSRSGFVPITDTIYAPYDPLLTIAGKPVNFILQPFKENDDKETRFKKSHFKFLGRWTHWAVGSPETDIKERFKIDFFKDLATVDQLPINGFMKIWIYEHFIVRMSCWPLFIHDFNQNFVVKDITSPTGVMLKKWAGLFASAEVGTLYRTRSMFGLGLTSMTTVFEQLQVIKCHLLKFSSDKHITALYHIREDREKAETGQVWRATRLASLSLSMVKHDLMYQHAEPGDMRGLGHEVFVSSDPSLPEHRTRCSKAVIKLHQEKLVAHAHTLAMQGVWTNWWERTISFDYTWNNLIYGTGPRVLSFVLNATINSLPSRDLLCLLGYNVSKICPLCGGRATVHHILVNCKKALLDKRYTWRHDSVLATLLQALQPVLISHNSSPPAPVKLPSIRSSFIPASTKTKCSSTIRTRSNKPRLSLLGSANDWKLLVDFDQMKILFPAHITSTDQRPDIILWSDSLRRVILVELTCPAEEGIEAASIRKSARYLELVDSINQDNRKYKWSAHLLTIESGARGFVAHSMRIFLKKIGFSNKQASKVCKDVSEVTARCSYGIWLMRDQQHWHSSRQLVVPNGEDYVSPPSLHINPALSYRSLVARSPPPLSQDPPAAVFFDQPSVSSEVPSSEFASPPSTCFNHSPETSFPSRRFLKKAQFRRHRRQGGLPIRASILITPQNSFSPTLPSIQEGSILN